MPFAPSSVFAPTVRKIMPQIFHDIETPSCRSSTAPVEHARVIFLVSLGESKRLDEVASSSGFVSKLEEVSSLRYDNQSSLPIPNQKLQERPAEEARIKRHGPKGKITSFVLGQTI